MVEGHLVKLSAAKSIGSGVANMGDRYLVVVEHGSHYCCAHALTVRLTLCGLVNDLVGAVNSITQND